MRSPSAALKRGGSDRPLISANYLSKKPGLALIPIFMRNIRRLGMWWELNAFLAALAVKRSVAGEVLLSNSSDKSRSRWLFPSGAVAMSIIYFWFYLKPPSLGSDTNRFVGCWNDHDWNCVANFISESELTGYGITREQAGNFVGEYCHPNLVGKIKLTRVTLTLSQMGQSFTAAGNDGIGRIDGMMVRSEGKTRFVDMISSLQSHVAVLKYCRKSAPSPDDLGRAWLQQSLQDREQLESLGIMGYLQVNKVTPWDEWQKGMEEGIRRREARANVKR